MQGNCLLAVIVLCVKKNGQFFVHVLTMVSERYRLKKYNQFRRTSGVRREGESMKFVNPRNDVAFKKIFGNEEHTEILISFLNAVLDLTGEKEIQEIELLNPYQAPRLEALKYTLLDVRAKDKRGVTFIVEMQVAHVEGLRKRFTYYTTKAYASQIERGQDYPKLNQVIFVGILNFNEFDTPHYLTRIQFLNTVTYQQEFEDLEFNFLELPKFTKQEQDLKTVLEKWIFFLKHADELDVIPDSADTAALRNAYDMADQFGWSKRRIRGV